VKTIIMRVLTFLVVTGLIAANVISIKTTDQQIAHSTAESVKYEQKLQKTLEERKTKQEEQSRIAATVTPEPSQKPVAQVPAPKPIQPAPKPKNTPQAVASGSCEAFRGLVSQYAWPVDQAMFVMFKESGCNPTNVSSTQDYGLFQLHLQKVFDPAQNIAIAYGKYVSGRVGSNNFSAWYAVCTPGNSPQPKYPGIKCQ
jgi:hypothetical protein